jgi:hypothetical protein
MELVLPEIDDTVPDRYPTYGVMAHTLENAYSGKLSEAMNNRLSTSLEGYDEDIAESIKDTLTLSNPINMHNMASIFSHRFLNQIISYSIGNEHLHKLLTGRSERPTYTNGRDRGYLTLGRVDDRDIEIRYYSQDIRERHMVRILKALEVVTTDYSCRPYTTPTGVHLLKHTAIIRLAGIPYEDIISSVADIAVTYMKFITKVELCRYCKRHFPGFQHS